MIAVTPGVVLSRRPWGESDRLAQIYTQEYGRMAIRFVGVAKPRGKLKPFCEPFVSAEYRLFLQPFSEYGKCIGGALRTVRPGLRADTRRIYLAFHLSELVEKLTPTLQPSPEKFALIEAAYDRIEQGDDGDRVALAFTLRLLDLAGLRCPAPPADQADWERLHAEPFEALAASPPDQGTLSRLRRQAEKHLWNQLDRPLETLEFLNAPSPSPREAGRGLG